LCTVCIQRWLSFDPVQQVTFRIVALHRFTSGDALSALGTGEHQPFDRAWLQSHRAAMLAKRRAPGAIAGAFALKTYHHCGAICHPGQALEHPDRASIAAKQVAGEGEFDEQHPSRCTDKQGLVAGRRQMEQVAVDLSRR